MATRTHDTLEFMVLQAFKPSEVVPLAHLCSRLSSANRSSVSCALLHLVADRSVRRVRHGTYSITEQGQVRRAERAGEALRREQAETSSSAWARSARPAGA